MAPPPLGRLGWPATAQGSACPTRAARALTEARQDKSQRRRWLSPLLRRILLLNALPPALLAAALLYLDQYQNGLLAAEVEALRTQARIYAGAIGEAATRPEDDRAVLVPELRARCCAAWSSPRPTPRRGCSTPPACVVADSRVREGAGRRHRHRAAAAARAPRGAFSAGRRGPLRPLAALLPRGTARRPRSDLTVDAKPDAPSFDWQPRPRPRPAGGVAARAGRRRHALYPPHRRWPPAGLGRRAGAARQPAGRHRAADARGAGGGPAAVRDPRQRARLFAHRAGADRAALASTWRRPWPPRSCSWPAPPPPCARARAAAAACRAPLLARDDEIGILARDLQARPARSGRGSTPMSASPPMSRMSCATR